MRRQQGISLIEALVSMVILAVGVLGLIRLQGYLYHSQISANDYNFATNLAQTALEERHAGISPALCQQSGFGPPSPNASGMLERFNCLTVDNASSTVVKVQWISSEGELNLLQLEATNELLPEG